MAEQPAPVPLVVLNECEILMSETSNWNSRPTIPDDLFVRFFRPRLTQEIIDHLETNVVGTRVTFLNAKYWSDEGENVRIYRLRLSYRVGNNGGSLKKLGGHWGQFVRRKGVREVDTVHFSWSPEGLLLLRVLRPDGAVSPPTPDNKKRPRGKNDNTDGNNVQRRKSRRLAGSSSKTSNLVSGGGSTSGGIQVTSHCNNAEFSLENCTELLALLSPWDYCKQAALLMSAQALKSFLVRSNAPKQKWPQLKCEFNVAKTKTVDAVEILATCLRLLFRPANQIISFRVAQVTTKFKLHRCNVLELVLNPTNAFTGIMGLISSLVVRQTLPKDLDGISAKLLSHVSSIDRCGKGIQGQHDYNELLKLSWFPFALLSSLFFLNAAYWKWSQLMCEFFAKENVVAEEILSTCLHHLFRPAYGAHSFTDIYQLMRLGIQEYDDCDKATSSLVDQIEELALSSNREFFMWFSSALQCSLVYSAALELSQLMCKLCANETQATCLCLSIQATSSSNGPTDCAQLPRSNSIGGCQYGSLQYR